MQNDVNAFFLDEKQQVIKDYQGVCFSSTFWDALPKGTKYIQYTPSLDRYVKLESLPLFHRFLQIHFPFFNEAEVIEKGRTIIVPWDNGTMTQLKAFAILTLMRYPAEFYYELVMPVENAKEEDKLKVFLDSHDTPGAVPGEECRDYLGYGHTLFNGNGRYGLWKNRNFFYSKEVAELLAKKGEKKLRALHDSFATGTYELPIKKEKEDEANKVA
jgi:hypothetical protein